MSGRKQGAEAARQRAAELRAEAARRRRRQTTVWVTAIVAVVLVAAGLIGWAVQSNRSSVPKSAVTTPHGLVGGSGVQVGTPAAGTRATVAVYEDFICPICRRFEQVVGPDLAQLAGSGDAKVVYHPIAILDSFSTTKYSTRSLAAAGCAVDQGKFVEYKGLLFAHQPSEGSAGLTNAELAALGGQVPGMDQNTFTPCVTGQRYRDWATKVSDEAFSGGVHGTPTIRVNGKVVSGSQGAVPTYADIKAAVDKANGK